MLRRYHETEKVGAVENTAPVSDVIQDATSALEATEEPKKYTRTEINRMSASDLRMIAPQYGIEATEETSGASLKKALIEMIGI